MKRMKNSIKALIIAICVVVVAIGAVVGIILVNKNKGGGGSDDSKPILNKTELKNLADEIKNSTKDEKSIDVCDSRIYEGVCNFENLVYLGERYFVCNTQSDGNGENQYYFYMKNSDGSYSTLNLLNKTDDEIPGFKNPAAVDATIKFSDNNYAIICNIFSYETISVGEGEKEIKQVKDCEYTILYFGENGVQDVFSISNVGRTEDYVTFNISLGESIFSITETATTVIPAESVQAVDDYNIVKTTIVYKLEQTKKSLDEIKLVSYEGNEPETFELHGDYFFANFKNNVVFYAYNNGDIKTLEIAKDAQKDYYQVYELKDNFYYIDVAELSIAQDKSAEQIGEKYYRHSYVSVKFENGEFVRNDFSLKNGYVSMTIEAISENSNSYFVLQRKNRLNNSDNYLLYQYYNQKGELIFEYETDRTDYVESIEDNVFVTTRGVYVITNEMSVYAKLIFSSDTYYSLETFSDDRNYFVYRYNGLYGIMSNKGDFVVNAEYDGLNGNLTFDKIFGIVQDYAIALSSSSDLEGVGRADYYLINCKTKEIKEIENYYEDDKLKNLLDVGYNFYLTKDASGKISLYQNNTLKYDDIAEIDYASNYASGVMLKIKMNNGVVEYLSLKNGNALKTESDSVFSSQNVNYYNENEDDILAVNGTQLSYYKYTEDTSYDKYEYRVSALDASGETDDKALEIVQRAWKGFVSTDIFVTSSYYYIKRLQLQSYLDKGSNIRFYDIKEGTQTKYTYDPPANALYGDVKVKDVEVDTEGRYQYRFYMAGGLDKSQAHENYGKENNLYIDSYAYDTNFKGRTFKHSGGSDISISFNYDINGQYLNHLTENYVKIKSPEYSRTYDLTKYSGFNKYVANIDKGYECVGLIVSYVKYENSQCTYTGRNVEEIDGFKYKYKPTYQNIQRTIVLMPKIVKKTYTATLSLGDTPTDEILNSGDWTESFKFPTNPTAEDLETIASSFVWPSRVGYDCVGYVNGDKTYISYNSGSTVFDSSKFAAEDVTLTIVFTPKILNLTFVFGTSSTTNVNEEVSGIKYTRKNSYDFYDATVATIKNSGDIVFEYADTSAMYDAHTELYFTSFSSAFRNYRQDGSGEQRKLSDICSGLGFSIDNFGWFDLEADCFTEAGNENVYIMDSSYKFVKWLLRDISSGTEIYYDLSRQTDKDITLFDYVKDFGTQLEFVACYIVESYLVKYTTLEVGGSSSMNDTIKATSEIKNVLKNIQKTDATNLKATYSAVYSVNGADTKNAIASAQYIDSNLFGNFTIEISVVNKDTYKLGSIVINNFAYYQDGLFKKGWLYIPSSNLISLYDANGNKYDDRRGFDTTPYTYGNAYNGHQTKIYVSSFGDDKVTLRFVDVCLPVDEKGAFSNGGSFGFEILACAESKATATPTAELQTGYGTFNGYAVQQMVPIDNNKKIIVGTGSVAAYALFSGSYMLYTDSSTPSGLYTRTKAMSGNVFEIPLTSGGDTTTKNASYYYIVKIGDNYYAYYMPYSSNTSSVVVNKAGYKNTHLYALTPSQKLFDVATSTIAKSQNNFGKGYYDLSAYLESLEIINSSNAFDTYNLFVQRKIPENASGNEYTLADYRITVKRGSYDCAETANYSSIFDYFGQKYILTQEFKLNDQQYLYFGRMVSNDNENETNYHYMYFIFSTVDYTFDESVKISYKTFDYSVNVGINDNGDRWSLDKNTDLKYVPLDIYVDNATSASTYTTGATANLYQTSIKNLQPSNTTQLRFTPHNGYLIKRLVLRYADKEISRIELTSIDYNPSENSYMSSLTAGGYVMFSYTGSLNNIVAYRGNGGVFGIYYSNAKGSSSWITNSINMESMFIVIAGINDNVSIDVETVSFADFMFEDSSNLFGLSYVSGGLNRNTLGSYTTASGTVNAVKLSMLVNPTGSQWILLGADDTTVEKSTETNILLSQSATDYRPLGVNWDGSNNLYKYDASYVWSILNGRNYARVAFLGKAYLFENGIKIYATSDSYSSYFTNVSVLGQAKDSNGSPLIGLTYREDGRTIMNSVIGRKENGATIVNSNGLVPSLEHSDRLVYIYLSKFDMASTITSTLGHVFWNAYVDGVNIYTKKFYLYMTVEANDVALRTNSYIQNSSPNLINGYENYLSDSSYNYRVVGGLENVGYRNFTIDDYKGFNYSKRGSTLYQLDYYVNHVDTIPDNTYYYMKRYSWFNDTILTNINMNYYRFNSANVSVPGEFSANWQNLNKTARNDKSSQNYDGVGRFGYKLTYVYYEIPGYYLSNIDILTKNYGLFTIPVDNIMTQAGLSGEISQSKFTGKLTLKSSVNDYIYYEFVYDKTAGAYTISFYNTQTTDIDYDNVCNSLYLIANEIDVNFYSNSYSGTISLKNYEDTYGTITSTLPDITNVSDITYQYDTLAGINTSMFTMNGYSFIGFGSEYTTSGELRFSPRTTGGTNTWNSSARFHLMQSYFAYGMRDTLLDLQAETPTDKDFYISNHDNLFYFITDTGNVKGLGGEVTQNYNFWSVYYDIFTSTIGKAYRVKTASAEDDGAKLRNINLYSIWKANTYMLSFDFYDVNSGTSNGSTISAISMNYGSVFNDYSKFMLTNYEKSSNAFGFQGGSQTYYFYVDYDSQNWYATTNPNFSYEVGGFQLYDKSSSNRFRFIIDRYGYTWLGWTFVAKQNHKNALVNSDIDNSSTIFASIYNNEYNSRMDVPLFNYELYSNFDLKNDNITPEFVYKYQYLLGSTSDNAKWQNIYFYVYSAGDGGVADFLNTQVVASETNPGLTYFDTSLSPNAYSYDYTNRRVSISRYSLQSAKLVNNRFVTLYAYWDVNAYYYIYDYRASDGTTSSGHVDNLNSIDDIGSSSISNKDKESQGPSNPSVDDADSSKMIYFDDSQTYDNNFKAEIPTRVGYDFLGYTFDFDKTALKNYAFNTPTNSSKKYMLDAQVTKYYKIYSSGAGVNNLNAAAVSGVFSAAYSSQVETYGGGKDSSTRPMVSYVYLFAVWQKQTFVSNISLDLSENRGDYLADNNYQISSYERTADGRTVSYDKYNTFVNSNYLKLGADYADIPSNVEFVYTFDESYENAYCVVDGTKYLLKDMFAISMGYYFTGWNLNVTASEETRIKLVTNTLKSIINSEGNLDYDVEGSSKINKSGLAYIFDYNFYKKLNRSNFVKNLSNNINKATNSVKLSSVDKVSESTNFGYLVINGKRHYLQVEYDESSGKYSMYFFYDGSTDVTTKYNSNIRFYVAPYYVNNSAYNLISFDNEFMYIAYGSDNVVNYPVQFDSNNNTYIVRGTWSGASYYEIRFAVFSEIDYKSTGFVVNAESIQNTSLNRLNYPATSGAIKFNDNLSLNTPATSIETTVAFGSTRQFTLYATWKLKDDDVNSIKIKNGSIAANDQVDDETGLQNFTNKYRYNDGLEGLFRTYISYNGTKVHRNVTDYTTVGSSRVAESGITQEYSFFDNIDMELMPFYNGRFLAEITLSFEGIEHDTTKTSVYAFKLVKYTVTYKFNWNSAEHSLDIDSVTITPSNNNTKDLKLSSRADTYEVTEKGKKLYTANYYKDSDSRSVFNLIQRKGSCYKPDSNRNAKFNILSIMNYAYSAVNSVDSDNDYTQEHTYGRHDVNTVGISLQNVMSSIEMTCKFSVQTYNVNLYNFLDRNGNVLSKIGDDKYNTPYSETEFNTKVQTTSLEGYPPFISSESAGKSNLVTIRQNIDNTTSTYNVPYGYFIYGMYYSKLNRPVSEAKYRDYNALIGQYYGFEYIYVNGNYNNGTNINNVLTSSGSGLNEDYFYSQCSALLGREDSSISVLLNLSSFTFGGWYSKNVSGGFVNLTNYNKESESTYINKDITLYGYYYAISKPTNIKFYTWDKNNSGYTLYTGNQNEYTLNSNITNSLFKINGNLLYADENVVTHVDGSGNAMLNIFTSYGADSEAFNKDEFSNVSFNANSSESIAILKRIMNTYWYYRSGYKTLYDEANNAYVKYNERTKTFTCNGHTVSVYVENLESERYYYIAQGSSEHVQLAVVSNYDYNFSGADPYIRVARSGGYNYYKLTKTDADYFAAINASEELKTANPKFYTTIEGVTYYVLPTVAGAASWNGNTKSVYDSTGKPMDTILGSSDFLITILKNYYLKVDNDLYPIEYKKNSLVVLDPTSNAGTVQYDSSTFYFDFNTTTLYQDAELTKKVTFKHDIYSAMNENYSINTKQNANNNGWVYGGVTVNALPSKNLGYWYNDPNFGVIGFIEVTAVDLQEIRGKIDDNGEYTGIKGLYIALIDQIYSDSAGYNEAFRTDLKNKFFGLIETLDIKRSLLVPKDYSFDENKNITRVKISIPCNLTVSATFNGVTSDYSISTNFDYDFRIISKNTSVDGDIDAIQVYSPYSMKFVNDCYETTGESISIETSLMDVNHFETKEDIAYIYRQVFTYDEQNNLKVEGDMLHLVMLSSEMFNKLKDVYTQTDKKLDLALNNIIRNNNLNVLQQSVSVNTEDQLVCETKLTFDGITTDDTYYIFAYYNKTGIEDSKSYVTRVSDNFIKIEKSGSGITASIVATSTEIG